MSELKRLEEELRLMEESLWYVKWAGVFIFATLVTEVIGLVELFGGHLKATLEMFGISLVLICMHIHLRRKSAAYYHKAHGEGK